MVVHVPCADSQRFAGIEGFPWVGRPVVGQSQQPFVNHGERVGHRTLRFFLHLDGEGRLRPYDGRAGDLRLQPGVRVGDRKRFNPVKPDGHVVGGELVRLQQGYLDIGVGRHIFRNLEMEVGGAVRTYVHTVRGKHFRSVFNRNQCHSACHVRNGDHDLLPDPVFLFVQRESEHLHRRRVLGVGIAAPRRPVHIEEET